ncbi:MAG: type II toxin-antitoxin system Phd/YefM family antitoxin [Deltaproteobacteria bacterium]|nr:type II toxin-antitoxin system Phd/YefM family antitoxin [Deltaproteobacteria bacterium]
MAKRWQLQEAKARLSAVVKTAEREGPQEITVHGKATAVLVSARTYARLARPRLPFVDFLRRSPLAGVKLRLDRDRTGDRDVEL